MHLTGGRVRGKYGMAMVWQRSGFEVVTRKEAERSMTDKGRKYIRDSFDNNSIILRISYVIDKEKTRKRQVRIKNFEL